MYILLIEDHQTVAHNTKKFLELEQYTVRMAHDGQEGLDLAMTEDIDLLILDINLPSMDGYTICQKLRQQGKKMPILMLTARSKQEEMINGLNIGADDYLTKPFDLDVLSARVRALLRRHGTEKTPIIRSGKMTIDTNTQQVWLKDKKISLSPKEYALLLFLVNRKGIAQDRAAILDHVWGNKDELLFSNTVDVHINFLRRKLGKDCIQTIPNTGYMISAD